MPIYNVHIAENRVSTKLLQTVRLYNSVKRWALKFHKQCKRLKNFGMTWGGAQKRCNDKNSTVCQATQQVTSHTLTFLEVAFAQSPSKLVCFKNYFSQGCLNNELRHDLSRTELALFNVLAARKERQGWLSSTKSEECRCPQGHVGKFTCTFYLFFTSAWSHTKRTHYCLEWNAQRLI